jgi:hypothetical protein
MSPPEFQLYQPRQTLFDRWVKYLSRRWCNALSPAFFVFLRGFCGLKRTLGHPPQISWSPSRDSLAVQPGHPRIELGTENL